MSASLHHLILAVSDREATADYLVDLLELSPSWENGFFRSVQLDDHIVINLAVGPVEPQHFAFLIAEDHFDRVLARFEADGTPFTADPPGRRPQQVGAVNADGTGRRMYFRGPAPDRHLLEVITARYDDVPTGSRPRR